MERFKILLPLRMFLGFVALVIWLGIWLTGFDTVHWVLFLPAITLIFGAVTGICPGLGLWRILLGSKSSA